MEYQEAIQICEIENRVGILFHSILEGNISKIMSLFTSTAVIELPDERRRVKGKAPIEAFWRKTCSIGFHEIKGDQDKRSAIHLPCDILVKPRKGGFYAEWDTYSFLSEQRGKLQYLMTHIQAWLECDLMISKLRWNEVIELCPVNLTADVFFHNFFDKTSNKMTEWLPWMEELKIEYRKDQAVRDDEAVCDYMEIRNLQGHFTHDGKERRPEWFSRSPDVLLDLPVLYEKPAAGYEAIEERLSDMRAKEENNGGNYIFLPLICAPLIDVARNSHTGIKQARGLWLVWSMEVRAVDGGTGSLLLKIYMNVGRFVQEFIFEDGMWRFLKFRHEILFNMDSLDYDPKAGLRHRMRESDLWENTWLPGPPKQKGLCPADVFEIEMMMPQWTGRIRSGNSMDFVERYMLNKAEEISMLVAGSTQIRTCGYENIKKRFGPKEKIGRRENPAFHTLASPVIEFSEDQKYASAAWTDVAMADFSGMFHFPKEPVCYYLTINKYYHKFVRDGDEWKLYDFGWEPGVPLGLFRFDVNSCRGFFKGWDSIGEFPLPEEPYVYPGE